MLRRIIPLLCILSLLQGCAAPLVVAGGAAAAGMMVAKDRRTAGTMLDDERIELRAQRRIADQPELLENSHVNVTSYNGVVLLSGEAVLPMYKQQVEQIVRQEAKVREIRNELRIAPLSESASRSRDAVLTTRVKTRLINSEGINASGFKVVSENATVYLMGMVSHDEAARAVQAVRSVPGVARIVKVFEYTD